MQSLKSTAFAVTLLAISFGLYCISTTESEPETDIEMNELIQIDSSESFTGGSMSLPSYDLGSQTVQQQISASVSPPAESTAVTQPESSYPTTSLTAPPLQASNSGSVASPVATTPVPMTLPDLSQPKPADNSLTLPASNTLTLPEIATRQPVATAPETRDEGLIDALDSNDFSPKLTLDDNSFNSQASAVAKDEDTGNVKSADGSLGGLSMPSIRKEAPASSIPFSIADVWSEVDRLVAADEYRKALGVLSRNYGRKGLTGPQTQRLQGWLDALAGKVIYSTEHHFVRKPYIVQRGETLESISRQLKIPTEVIFNINRAQFGSSNEVSPGMELKVINGPFHAEVNLETKMMTLFVEDLYAGRFPVAVGISGNPGKGHYKVMVKSPTGYTWRDANGKEYAPGTPGNGYGPYWIGLSGSLCIHAVPSGTPHGHRGCIGLSEADAKDIYGILSKQSQISIVR